VAPLPQDQSLHITVLWGVEGVDMADADSENGGALVYDHSFDLTDGRAQLHLANVCDALRADPNSRADSLLCVMEEFRPWAAKHFNQFPVPPQWTHNAFIAFLATHTQWGWSAGVDPHTKKVLWLSAILSTYQDKDADAAEMYPVYEKWESQMAAFNRIAPPTANKGFQLAREYSRAVVERAFISGTTSSILVSSTIICATILVFTRNLYIMMSVMFCILATVVSLLGLFELWGWPFGVVEALCSSLVTGLAVDYVLHLGHAYNHSFPTAGSSSASRSNELQYRLTEMTDGSSNTSTPGVIPGGSTTKQERFQRTRTALLSIGPSIVAAAATSIFSMCVLLFCNINLFYKVGLVIAVTLLLGLVYSLVLFSAILMVAGPTGVAGDVFTLWRMLVQCCSARLRPSEVPAGSSREAVPRNSDLHQGYAEFGRD